MAKRLFDLLCSTVGLVVLAPVLLGVSLLILLEDGAPVFFRQVRAGRGGRPFRIWKFRTMFKDAESRGRLITVGRDPRITRMGAWLRDLKIDELPQLLNVVAGKMSLVGPRPEVLRYVEGYTEDQRKVLDLTPGITDLASIAYRRESELLAQSQDPEAMYVQTIIPDKIRINLAYAEQATVWSDFKVILATLHLLKIAPHAPNVTAGN